MNEEQKKKLRSKLPGKILGWDHCHNCNRSQSRFEFYYQEQFDEAAKVKASCVFCGEDLATYHESEDGPFSRPEGWRVRSLSEFEQEIKELNAEFGCDLKAEMFKSSHADYMHRPVEQGC